MTDKNLSQLDVAADLNNTDLLHVRQSGIDRSVSFQVLKEKVATSTNVTSVNGMVGVVVLDAEDVSAEPSGTTASALSSHVSAPDPHAQYALESDVSTSLSGKQDTLVSGSNIKTINGETLLGSGDIVITGGSGEVNTASNLGTGAGIFAAKVAEDLQFKSLVAGSGVVLTPSADSIQIDATGSGGGEANTGANVGTGEGSVFKDKTGVTLNFKTLKQGSNVTITNNTDDVTIAAASPPVTSVFTRTGAVVAEAGDYQASDITASVSATNYTPSAATVEGHLVGIDNALASSGGGGSGGIMQWQNTGNLTQTSLSTTSPGTVIDIGGANVAMTINAITGGSFNAATDTITLPAGKYQLTVRCRTSTSASNPAIHFRLQTSSGDAISKTFAGNLIQVSGTTPDPTLIVMQAIGDYAFSLTGTTSFTVNAIVGGSGTIISSVAPSDTVGPTFCLTILKVA